MYKATWQCGLGAIQGAAAGNDGRILVLYFPPAIQGRIGRTSSIVKDETRRGRVGRTLSLHVSLLAFFFFFDMQTLLSHPYSEIVSRVAKGGWCDDGNPISIWTITLPSGLAVHLFQFDWLGEPRLPKQPAQPLYSVHQARAGDWWAWSISVGSSCSGLNMLTPLKLARDPRSVWITLCSPIRPCMCVCVPILTPVCLFLLCVYMCLPSCVGLSVLMYDHESGVLTEPAHTHHPFRHSTFPH